MIIPFRKNTQQIKSIATHIPDNDDNSSIIDIFSFLLKERVIFLSQEITPDLSNLIISQLLWLDSISSEEIKIYINSPGGSVYDGLAIYDVMQSIESPISTVAVGLAASMAAIILLSGTKGLRKALPHSRVLLHQPLGWADGQASDIEIANQEIQKTKKELFGIIEKHTQEIPEIIINTCDRDKWLTAEESLTYGKQGIIDSIVQYKK